MLHDLVSHLPRERFHISTLSFRQDKGEKKKMKCCIGNIVYMQRCARSWAWKPGRKIDSNRTCKGKSSIANSILELKCDKSLIFFKKTLKIDIIEN